MVDRGRVEPGCCWSAWWWTVRPNLAILQLIDGLIVHTALGQGKQGLRHQRSVWGLTVLQLLVVALVFQEVLDRAMLWLDHGCLFAIDHFLDDLGAILDWPTTRWVKTDYFRRNVFLFHFVYVLVVACATYGICITFLKLHGQFRPESLRSIGICACISATF